MTACIGCKNLGLKAYPQFVSFGYGRCAAKQGATFVEIGLDQPCKLFTAEDAQKVAARVKWWDKTKEKK